MKCMYCLFGLFLLVLIVSSSAEMNWQKKAGDEKNNIGQEPKLERRRRGLYPNEIEYRFFLKYFQAIGREQQYKNSISNGVANWRIAFGGKDDISYSLAIQNVTDYYIDPARRGALRKEAISMIGAIIKLRERYIYGLDVEHQRIVAKWTAAKERLIMAN